MIFSSNIFLFVFLPTVLIGYYLIDKSYKNAFLLAASILFYAYGEPSFVIIMIVLIIANYFWGIIIHNTLDASLLVRRSMLIVATVTNLFFLVYYKYSDFIIVNINGIFGSDWPLRNLLLPIGISFFTFQGMSYLFDVYRGTAPVQRNFIHVALYIALFPQLVAGPIVRYTTISEQLTSRKHSVALFISGIQRFIIGLGKKAIIANQTAVIADYAFSMGMGERTIALAWLGAIAYTLQIYFDFSGYSDMAIGLGRMFGFEFLENFNYPYIANSVTDFHRRWHISLSSWFRDYLYFPLGGNRKGNVYVNLLIVFFMTGLWHGASWNFIVWGMWYGVFLIIERIFKKYEIKITVPKIVPWFYAMVIVVLGRVIFRADDLPQAWYFIQDMFGANGNAWSSARDVALLHENLVILILSCVLATPVVKLLGTRIKEDKRGEMIYNISSPVLYTGLLLVAVSYVVVGGYNPFIYFNF